MTLPDWTFSEVSTQMVNFLQNGVISGLVLAGIALSLAMRIIAAIRRVGE